MGRGLTFLSTSVTCVGPGCSNLNLVARSTWKPLGTPGRSLDVGYLCLNCFCWLLCCCGLFGNSLLRLLGNPLRTRTPPRHSRDSQPAQFHLQVMLALYYIYTWKKKGGQQTTTTTSYFTTPTQLAVYPPQQQIIVQQPVQPYYYASADLQAAQAAMNADRQQGQGQGQAQPVYLPAYSAQDPWAAQDGNSSGTAGAPGSYLKG